jgi:Zn-dependent protease with chaperone function
VNEVAQRLDALPPEHIIVGLDPNFFVTEAEVQYPGGTCNGRTLYCSLPLSRILRTEEFIGIIGHELGHFKGEDTKFSQQFFPIYRGTVNSIAALQHSGGQGSGVIALLPAIALFSYFLECFSVAERTYR